MPVPVSVTHQNGAGLQAHSLASLETQGPFARLKQQQQQQQPAQATALAAAAGDVQQGSVLSTPRPGDACTTTGQEQPSSICVSHLDFSYPGLDGRPIPNQPPLIQDMSFALPPGSRCLLLGSNGAGKTTFLKLLGGKHMVPPESIRVLGQPPFHCTELTSSGELAYVGGNWQRDVAFAGYSVPLAGDFPARRMIDAVPHVDAARKARLVRVLDIDLDWRMHQVSDGQRRRVQICVGLLRPFKVLLLDEITVDLDVLGRADLLKFLQEECETRGCTIIYATHIFDGLEFWPTHLAYLARGQMLTLRKAEEVPELAQGRLLDLVYRLLKEEADRVQKARGPRPLEWDPSREGQVHDFSYAFNNGWVPGTLGTSLSTNAVMRN